MSKYERWKSSQMNTAGSFSSTVRVTKIKVRFTLHQNYCVRRCFDLWPFLLVLLVFTGDRSGGGGLRSASGLSWFLSGKLQEDSLHRVSRQRNLQLLHRLLQLLARCAQPQRHVQVLHTFITATLKRHHSWSGLHSDQFLLLTLDQHFAVRLIMWCWLYCICDKV